MLTKPAPLCCAGFYGRTGIDISFRCPSAKAAPIVYVANFFSNTVSVIDKARNDKARNNVVATILLPAGTAPSGVGVVPP
jgi:YVTN family beta-propeller protein